MLMISFLFGCLFFWKRQMEEFILPNARPTKNFPFFAQRCFWYWLSHKEGGNTSRTLCAIYLCQHFKLTYTERNIQHCNMNRNPFFLGKDMQNSIWLIESVLFLCHNMMLENYLFISLYNPLWCPEKVFREYLFIISQLL